MPFKFEELLEKAINDFVWKLNEIEVQVVKVPDEFANDEEQLS